MIPFEIGVNVFGLTRIDLMKLAYEIAETSGFQNPSNARKCTASKKWYYNFLK